MIQAFEQLEKEFGDFIGNPNTVAVSSGTSALHIACEVARTYLTDDVTGAVQPRIAVPEYTMVACPRAACMADLKPVFVGCLDNLQMNMNLVPDDIDIVMAVHIYGNLCDTEYLHTLTGSMVIEDMAEVHGARPHPNTFAACWSFYKNKTIHGEEGGMIAFKNVKDVNLAKQLRTLGFDNNHDYYHVPRGVNARMSNAHAELILPSLRDAQGSISHRHVLSNCYSNHVPIEWQLPTCRFPWIYPLRIKGMNWQEQRELVDRFNDEGVAARQGFKSMLQQAEYHSAYSEGITKAISLQHEVIYLPLSDTMTYANAESIGHSLMRHAKIVIPKLTRIE